MAPYREHLVVAVECLCTWYWLADLCAQEALPFVLGHALSMQAIHGGQATHDTLDAQKMAVRLRGGLLPQAAGDPAKMRATPDLLRRRLHLRRKRAALLPHGQPTNGQSHGPEIGQQRADQANRRGVAARLADPAVPHSLAGDRALIAQDDRGLHALEGALLTTAKQPEAHPLSLLQTVPGSGHILRLVRLDERHDSERVPRGQDGVSSCRGVNWAKESAGTRSGTAGPTLGQASRTWACAEAAVRF